jgi:hypothetical protein
VAQEEPVGVLGAEPPIEILDAGARRRQDRRVLREVFGIGIREVAEDGEMDARVEVAEREHLHVLQQRRHPRGARQQRRHHHHRAGFLRDALNAIGEVETTQTAGWQRPGDDALGQRDRDVGGRDQQNHQRDGHRPYRSALIAKIGAGRSEHERRHDRDRTQVHERRVREHQTADPFAEWRPVGHVGFEIATSPIDQVVSDVGRAIAGRPAHTGLPRALDRLERHPHLRLAGRRRELLDRLTLPVAAQEVHPCVGAGGIALQHLLDQADRFEILPPVEHGTEAQAGNRIRDRHLRRRLALVFHANRRFRRRLLRREVLLDRRPDRRLPGAVLADPVQELDDRRDVEGQRQLADGVSRFALEAGHVGVGGEPGAARLHGLDGQTSQVFDQRQLQHAGPRPELTDRQRRDALVAVDEHHELLTVDPAVAVAHQFDGHRVDAGVARLLARGERRQLAVVGAGQMLVDIPDLRRHQVEVVEQPFGRGGDELAGPEIVRQRAVRLAEDAGVVGEPGKDVAGAAPRIRVDGEAGGEGEGAFFEPFDAEQLVAKRFLRRGRLALPESPEQSAHRISPPRHALVSAGGPAGPPRSGKREIQYTVVGRGHCPVWDCNPAPDRV